MYRHGIVTRDQIPNDHSMHMTQAPDLAFTVLGEIDLPVPSARRRWGSGSRAWSRSAGAPKVRARHRFF
jgi:hypothetical protein